MPLSNLILVLLLGVAQAMPSVDTLASGVEKSLREMRDFSAGFEQIFKDSSNRETRSRGHLYLKRDGGDKKMRAHYMSPQEKLYLSDGKTFTEYSPQVKQAIQGPAKKSENEIVPFMLLLGERNVFEPFERKESKTSQLPGHGILHLTPRDKKLPVVEMEVNSSTFVVRQLALTYPDGSQTTYIFTDPRVNSGVSSSVFEFDVKGVQIIQQK